MTKPSGLRVLVVIGSVAFTFGTVQAMLRPLIAPYALHLGGDALTAGIAVSVGSLPGFLMAVPLGSLADRHGRRWVVLAGAALLSVAGLTLLFFVSVTGLMVAQSIHGFALLGMGVGVQAIAAAAVGDVGVDSRRVAVFSTGMMGGQLVGPTFGGVLTDLHGYAAVFIAITALGLVALVTAVFLPRDARTAVHVAQPTNGPRRRPGAMSSYQEAWGLTRQEGVLATATVSALGVGLLQARMVFLPLYLAGIGWSASAIGLVLSGAAVAALIARAALPMLERRFSLRVLNIAFVLAGALGLAVAVLLVSTPLIWVAVLTSGFGLSGINPLTLSALARLVASEQRGLVVGLRFTGNRFANSAAPLLVGALGSIVTVRTALFAWCVTAWLLGSLSCRRLS